MLVGKLFLAHVTFIFVIKFKNYILAKDEKR